MSTRRKTEPMHYNARWYGPSATALADVSLKAKSDESAIKIARRIASHEVHLPNTDFTLYSGSRHVFTGR